MTADTQDPFDSLFDSDDESPTPMPAPEPEMPPMAVPDVPLAESGGVVVPDTFAHPTLVLARGPDQSIVIQATIDGACCFYSFHSESELEFSRYSLERGRFVREHVDKRFKRRPFADVDCKATDPDILAAVFGVVFGVQPLILSTTKGYHLIGREGWISLREHRAGLSRLAKCIPGVDLQAVSSLRVAGTADKAGSTLKQSADTMYETLVQPLGAPPDVEQAVSRDDEKPIPPEYIAIGITALTSDPTAFPDVEQVGTRVKLDRAKPSDCKICKRTHDNACASLVFFMEDLRGRAYCSRDAKSKGVSFKLPGCTNTWAGPFDSRTGADMYESPTMRPAPPGSYLDASPCGLGKSKAAYASIPSGAKVVVLSYRRTFTAAEVMRHEEDEDGRLSSYTEKEGPIYLADVGRVAIQIESLHRVVGRPDVLIVDELHGIARHLMSSSICDTKHFKVLSEYMKHQNTRVIVLDAYATDADHAWVEKMCERPVAYVRNTIKPHTDRDVRMMTPDEWQPQLEDWLDQRAKLSMAERMDSRFVIICHCPSTVTSMSILLDQHNVVHKAYHGQLECPYGPDVRAAHFKDPHAWDFDEAVIYNSVLEAGVSVESPQWRTAWCKFSGISTVEASIQMMHRFRNIKLFYVAASGGHVPADAPIMMDSLVDWIGTSEEWAKANTTAAGECTKRSNVKALIGCARAAEAAPTAKEKPKAPRRQVIDTLKDMVNMGVDISRYAYADWWLRTRLEDHRSGKFWIERFIRMLQDTGFVIHSAIGASTRKLVPIDIPIDRTRAWLVGNATTEAWVAAQREVCETATEKDMAQVARPLSATEVISREKCKLLQAYEVQAETVTCEFVDTYGGNKTLEAHRRLKRLATEDGAKGHAHAVELMKGKALYLNKNAPLLNGTEAERASVALTILNAMGFANLVDERKVAKSVVAAVVTSGEIDKALASRGRLWKDMKGKPPAKTLVGYLRAANTVLEEMYGVSIKSTSAKHTAYHLESTVWPTDPLKAWREAERAKPTPSPKQALPATPVGVPQPAKAPAPKKTSKVDLQAELYD